MRTLRLVLIGMMLMALHLAPAYARASRECMRDCRKAFFTCLDKSGMKTCTPPDRACRKRCNSAQR